jgi:hypothetical protein
MPSTAALRACIYNLDTITKTQTFSQEDLVRQNTNHCYLNRALQTFNTITLVCICALLYQPRPMEQDSASIQERITRFNTYSEQRINTLSASHDQLKSEMESRMSILETRVKLLKDRNQ